MTPEQLKRFSEAYHSLSEAMAQILNSPAPTLERQKRPEPMPIFTTADNIQVLKSQKLFSFLSNGEIVSHPTWEDASDKYSSWEEAENGYDRWLRSQAVLSMEDISKIKLYDDQWPNLKRIAKEKIATR